jgi:hypothetical protein
MRFCWDGRLQYVVVWSYFWWKVIILSKEVGRWLSGAFSWVEIAGQDV